MENSENPHFLESCLGLYWLRVMVLTVPNGEIHMITGGMAAGGTLRSSRKTYVR